jgi:hypothetical protein
MSFHATHHANARAAIPLAYRRPPRTRAVAPLMLLLAALSIAVNTSAAQSADEQAAYTALIYTPVAGLPPLPPVIDSLGRSVGSGVSLLGRLGHMSRDGGSLALNTLGVGVEVPRGRMRLGATLAYLTASCNWEWKGADDCAGDIMIGGSVRTLLTNRPLGANGPPQKGRQRARTSNDSRLLVGFDGSVGYSPRQGETAMAIAAGIPTAIALRSGTVRIMPFITPGIGYGRLSAVTYCDCEAATAHGTFALMVGGGLGLEFGTSGIGANVGFQRVLKSYGGVTQLGVGVTWQGLAAATR